MPSKLIIIISTDEKGKALTGMMYAKNALKYKWLDDVKVFFFGPVEKLIFEDDEVRKAAGEVTSLTECFACKAISDRERISESLNELGMKVDYVGGIISSYIKEGYLPMIW